MGKILLVLVALLGSRFVAGEVSARAGDKTTETRTRSSTAVAAAGTTVPVLKLSAPTRTKCLDVLRSALKSERPEDFWPAMHAAEALSLAGQGGEVLAALPARLATDKDDQHRCGLARELYRAGDTTAIRHILAVLAKPEKYGHTHASESLFKIADIGNGHLMRQRVGEPGEPPLKIMQHAALARCGNLASLRTLREMASRQGFASRWLAGWCLSVVGDRSDIPAIRKFANETKDELHRAFAEHALAVLGEQQGAVALVRNLSSKNDSIRIYAANFSGDARLISTAHRLEQLLDDPVVDVRVRAAQSLLTLASPPTASTQEVILRDLFPASKAFPRYSEGDVIRLKNGHLLAAVTEFAASTSDFAKARIVAKESADGGRTWSEKRTLQETTGKLNTMSVTLRYLAHEVGPQTPLAMFILQKNSYTDLQGFVRFSSDEGRTFGPMIQFTSKPGYHTMNNDRVTLLSTGRILCPVAWSPDIHKVNHLISWCYISDDGGKSWRAGKEKIDLPKRGALEPETIELRDGRVMMIMRTTLGYIATAISSDGGDTWSKPSKFPLKAPDAPATIRRIPATGDLLLIWNNNYVPNTGHVGKRNPLAAAISSDEGTTWKFVKNLEATPGETYAYTSAIFDGPRAVLTYYVENEKSRRYSQRFRSLPISWFYAAADDK